MKINFKIPNIQKTSTTDLIQSGTKKQIIVTIMSGKSVELIGRSSIPFMREAAIRWDSSFAVLRTADVNKYAHPSCGKGELWRWLDDGWRVAWIDLDTLTKRNCPNLFEEVPEGKLGIVERGKYWGKKNQCYPPKIMEEYIQKYNETFPEQPFPKFKNYNGLYYNAGVFVCDASCFPLEQDNVPLIGYRWEWIEQTLFNVLIHYKKTPIHKLDWRFNASDGMIGFEGTEEVLLRDCYIRHYTVMKNRLIKDAKGCRK